MALTFVEEVVKEKRLQLGVLLICCRYVTKEDALHEAVKLDAYTKRR